MIFLAMSLVIYLEAGEDHILDKSLTTSNIQIFIGEESGYKIFDNCTLITAPYTNEEGSIGVLGVIGPTRMAYQRVIPIVDVIFMIQLANIVNKRPLSGSRMLLAK